MTCPPLTKDQRTVNEGGSFTYEATLKDEDEVALALASIDSLTLTLVNVADSSVINSRSNQDVKNDNNVTVHATSGLMTWELQPEDTVIIDTTLERDELEAHEATFKLTYATIKKLNWTVKLYVRQLSQV